MTGYLSAQCSDLILCLSFSFPLSSHLLHPSPKLSLSYGNWEIFHEDGNEIPSSHTDNESSKEFFPPSSVTFHNKQIHWWFHDHITSTPMSYHPGLAAKSDTQFALFLPFLFFFFFFFSQARDDACLHCWPVYWNEQGLKHNLKGAFFCAMCHMILRNMKTWNIDTILLP